MAILTWIVLCLVAAWLAGQFMPGGYGLVGDSVLGIVALIAISRMFSGRRLRASLMED